ncbi:hypothetical protein GJ496_000622 [Pomphorhynchus laevis]|nr:hypothetical protein GJ496_000622 [Pomphorhynchus laevis]
MDASSTKSPIENLQSSIQNATQQAQRNITSLSHNLSSFIPNNEDLPENHQSVNKCSLCSSGGSEESQCHIVPGTEVCRQPEQVGFSNLNTENNSEDDVDDDDDNHRIVAESPDGRWQRRNQTVSEKDVPGIDAAYLAIDTEEGVEVVWNEMDIFTDDNLNSVNEIDKFFANLIKLDHPNVVKFHNYCYLHGCIPPIIHGVLTTDSIFIQNNGLVKIGSISPDLFASRTHAVKDWSFSTGSFMAPELSLPFDRIYSISPAIDIYMFGLVALEMQNAELNLKTLNGSPDEESILSAVSSLDPTDQDFLRSCLRSNPFDRPSAKQLLHHPAVFEIYSLRLLCAHKFVNHTRKYPNQLSINRSSTSTSKINGLAHLTIEDYEDRFVAGKVLAVLTVNGKEIASAPSVKPTAKQDLCNFLEDVRNGHYPLTIYAVNSNHNTQASSNDIAGVNNYVANSGDSSAMTFSSSTKTGQGVRSIGLIKGNYQAEPEHRRIVDVQICKFEKVDQNRMQFTVQLNMLDMHKQEHMRRNLSAVVTNTESSKEWTDELIRYGFISQEDDNLMMQSINEAFLRLKQPSISPKSAVSDCVNVSASTASLTTHPQQNIQLNGMPISLSTQMGDTSGSTNDSISISGNRTSSCSGGASSQRNTNTTTSVSMTASATALADDSSGTSNIYTVTSTIAESDRKSAS